jgi:hypothetical protein
MTIGQVFGFFQGFKILSDIREKHCEGGSQNGSTNHSERKAVIWEFSLPALNGRD